MRKIDAVTLFREVYTVEAAQTPNLKIGLEIGRLIQSRILRRDESEMFNYKKVGAQKRKLHMGVMLFMKASFD